MFQNEQGIKVYEAGDVVQVGKGKVEWTVKSEGEAGALNLVNKDNGRERRVGVESVTLIRGVKHEHGPELEIPEGHGTVVEQVHDEHIPGETLNEHAERTGHKLDGRTTRYGRAVLAALQRKAHVFEGKRRAR